MNTPKWLADIQLDAEGMPFGTMTFSLKRHRNMTTKIEATTQNTLKYTENDAVFADLERLLNNLIDNRFTGTVQFEVGYSDGSIRSLTIKNKKTVNYRDK